MTKENDKTNKKQKSFEETKCLMSKGGNRQRQSHLKKSSNEGRKKQENSLI